MARKEVVSLGRLFEKLGIADAKITAMDKTMIEAIGPKWHKKDRKRGIIPEGLRNVDKESTWGKSKYRGWVQGHSLLLHTTAGLEGETIPIDVVGCKNSDSENKVAEELIENIPSKTKVIIGDNGFDDEKPLKKVEKKESVWKGNTLFVTTIRMFLVCIYTIGKDATEFRKLYYNFFKSKQGKKIYARRKVTIEPMFEDIKGLFELRRCWMKGSLNNYAIFTTVVLVYSLIMYYNYRKRKPVKAFMGVLGVI